MTDLEEFVDHMKTVIDDAYSKITEPNEEMPPFLCLECGDTLNFLDCRAMMQGEQGKDIFAWSVMPATIRQFEATQFAFVSETWSVADDNLPAWVAEHPDASLEEHPDHKEYVMVMAGSADGTFCNEMAEIRRHANAPPVLGEWDRPFFGDYMDNERVMTGRMVEPAMAAITGRPIVSPMQMQRATEALYFAPAMHEIIDDLLTRFDISPGEFTEMTDEEREELLPQIREALFNHPRYDEFTALLEEQITGEPEIPEGVALLPVEMFEMFDEETRRKLLGGE